MKRGVIAIILFMLLGAATSVGVAWWCALRAVDWSEADVQSFDHEGWFGFQWRAPGVSLVAAAGHDRAFLTSLDEQRKRASGQVEPPGSSMARRTDAAEGSWISELACGWPMLCARVSTLRTEESFSRWLIPRPNILDEGEVVILFPYLGLTIEGGVSGRTPWRGDVWRDARLLPVRPIWRGLIVNTALCGIAWWLLLGVYPVRRLRSALRRRRDRCPSCRYDRSGALDGPCPECGQLRSAHTQLFPRMGYWCGATVLAVLAATLVGFVVAFAENPSYLPIHVAAYEGDDDEIRRELESGVRVDVLSEPDVSYFERITPLQISALQGHTGAVRVLLNGGADVDFTGEAELTPLECALRAPGQTDIELIRLLVDAGANVNPSQRSPLADACARGDREIISLLLNCGADVNWRGGMPLGYAIQFDHSAVVMQLLELGAVIEGRHVLAAAGRKTTWYLEALMQRGGDIHTLDPQGMNAWFGCTAPNGHDVAELLADNNVDVNLRDKHDYSILDYTVQNGDVESAQLLLEYGADVNARNEFGETPLSRIAVLEDPLPLAQLLIAHGAHVNPASESYDPPLNAAVTSGSLNLVRFLIENGADVTIRGHRGRTALHEAVYYSYADRDVLIAIVTLLMEHGANVNERDDDGDTPLHIALRREAWLARVLLKHDADPTVLNESGESPLSQYESYDQPDDATLSELRESARRVKESD